MPVTQKRANQKEDTHRWSWGSSWVLSLCNQRPESNISCLFSSIFLVVACHPSKLTITDTSSHHKPVIRQILHFSFNFDVCSSLKCSPPPPPTLNKINNNPTPSPSHTLPPTRYPHSLPLLPPPPPNSTHTQTLVQQFEFSFLTCLQLCTSMFTVKPARLSLSSAKSQ